MGYQQPVVNTSPEVSDEVRKTTCYMCACRCGINVHMKGGKVAYIEGNRDHPVNKGVLCAKGSSGIMQHNAPSRLRAPMRRVGPRGSGEFEEISWDEALEVAVAWLKPLREQAPEKLAFFTGRDQSQSFTGFWALQFGTPNYAAHGGFCSVNMAAGGIYTMGGSFWEFGQPDWDHTKLLMLFGVAEDHDSNPIKMGLGKIKARGARVIGVNPIRTGYNAVADDWVGITPGTDGLFILSLVHELLKAGRVDLDYLARFTNAPCLVNAAEGAEKGLLLRDDDGKPLVIDRATGRPAPFDRPGVRPDLGATLDRDGATHRTVFQLMVEKYLSPDYAPEAVADRCGVPAARIRAIAAELARVAFDEAFEIEREWTDFRGEKHARMIGRPVSFHAMRGISAHANGFQTCRALHTLQIVLGTVEVPGGFRFKPPYPKPVSAHPKPHAGVTPGQPLDGPHLGYVTGPDDLLLREDGSAARIDKAYTWENPMSAHGLMHMLISNAHAGDPYRIDTLFLYMANMSWNSSMNTRGVIDMLTDTDESGEYVIPRIIYSDAYSSEMVAYADLILPDTTYLERHDCISLLDRPICEADAAADSIRWPVVDPDRDVRPFQSVMIDLGARLGLPAFVNEDGSPKWKDYADYIVNHERKPGIGPLIGFRGKNGDKVGRGEPNPDQLDRYIENGGFFEAHIPPHAAYYKPWNAAYQDWAVALGLYDSPQPYIFDLYSEPLRRFQLAAEGHGDRQPPDHLRQRILDTMDPLATWYEPDQTGNEGYTITALTQRPMAMYHSWGSQNAWLRQLHGRNPLYVSSKIMREAGLKDGDWARVTSPHGSIIVPVMEMAALNDNTVWTWNAIGKRKGAWALTPDAPEATKGFLLNHIINELLPRRGDGLRWANSDPITGQAAWFDLKVRIEKAANPEERTECDPAFPPIKSPVGTGPKELRWKVGR
ncbi:molybdopterin oxidoreductase family protein [Jhaorihella thermophila]|uniref:Anaerobic selenocysteine-containing dehydrogenase n=1 Tax=Jhaorihella thermophila TaxID=488547 RepID=A0A1H5W3X3_9RHOB|nr:molybdopterin oxidoreductase family protein [Jhaorihella thermophila]SEF93507.1 Anaerobic selenocysteine-containing dehydrogenase [Jhaorihella thermophila]